MSDKPAPQQPDSSTVMAVLDRLLGFMTSPWKAAVVVVLLIVCAAIYLVYLERARIADAVLREPIMVPRLLIPRFETEAEPLLRDARADLAVLVELRLVDNVSIDRVGIDRDGKRWVPIEGPQPAVVPDGSTALLARFLDNQVVCFDTAAVASEEGRVLAEHGYTRGCLVSVPPVLGTGVGGLLLAWKVRLSPAAEARAGLVMSTAAMRFATW